MSAARVAAASLVPLLLVAGCGGSSAKSGSTTSGLSKADYITQSEAICKKANADLDALPEGSTAAELSTTLDSGLTIAGTATSELSALAAKQPDAANLEKIFTGPLKEQVAALTVYIPKFKAAAAQGDAALTALGEPKLAKADTAAMKTYGFTDCIKTAEND